MAVIFYFPSEGFPNMSVIFPGTDGNLLCGAMIKFFNGKQEN